MKLFPRAKALFALLLGLVMVAGLSACGDGGGDADTDAPTVKLNPIPVTTTVRTRLLSGTVEGGETVEVTADSAMVTMPTISTPSVADGAWSCSVDLVLGNNTLYVKASDSTGNNKTLALVLTYEVFTLDQVLLSTSVQGQTLSGTLASGASLSGKLIRTSDSVEVQDIPAITANNWTQTLIALDPGTYTLILTGSDAIPQTTTLTQTLVVDSSLPLLTVNPAAPVGKTVSLSGTATATANVSIVASTAAKSGTITQPAGNGTWSCELSELVPGRNIITITATTTAMDGSTATATAQLAVMYQP